MNTARSTAGRLLLRAARLVLAASLCGWWRPGEASAAAPESASLVSTQTVVLSYQETRSSVAYWSCKVKLRQTPFPREPEVSATETHRGTLTVGEGAEGISFLWDRNAGRLYFDLNRNEDLTDDTNGVYTCPSMTGRGSRYQMFHEVRLSLPTAAGSFPLFMDLNMIAYGPVRATAVVRSFFGGKLTVQDKDWQIGIVGCPGAKRDWDRSTELLLRPWEERERPLVVGSEKLEMFDFSPRLFFQGRAWRLEGEFDLQAAPPCYRLRLTEQPVTLGEVRFSGRFIRRVVLRGGDWTAVVDEPGETARVPVGAYDTVLARLRQGNADAYLEDRGPMRGPMWQTVVRADQPATLAVGGPLTNSATVRQRGQMLVLDYRLLGAGGHSYRLLRTPNDKPPRFAVYRGNRKIASGNFEYG